MPYYTVSISGPAASAAEARAILEAEGLFVLSGPVMPVEIKPGEALLEIATPDPDISQHVVHLGWRHRQSSARFIRSEATLCRVGGEACQ